ncbi:MAG: sterol desaturase/sphingolipid hydroxylase (fatty acid hydroxylase superfamily) [Limisphaerales bacterium]
MDFTIFDKPLDFPDVPPVQLWAIPIMLSLVILEWYLGQRENNQRYEGKDFISSLGVGVGNLMINVLIGGGIYTMVWVVYSILPWRIPNEWWAYPLCIVAIDFCRYWAHRVAHEQRFWWATHVTHHSSVYYNFSVSFRLSWTQHIKIIFFIPAIMIGFNPLTYFICHQIEVLYQFWIHTEFIKKLPAPIEYIFVTPSHHRVHHGINERYIDKNYGSTFIFWDRIFGTFQEEDEKPVYGITEPVNSFNPVKLVFHEWQDIVKDVSKADTMHQKLKMIFGRPGVKS